MTRVSTTLIACTIVFAIGGSVTLAIITLAIAIVIARSR